MRRRRKATVSGAPYIALYFSRGVKHNINTSKKECFFSERERERGGSAVVALGVSRRFT
jgi:hypothetical protein